MDGFRDNLILGRRALLDSARGCWVGLDEETPPAPCPEGFSPGLDSTVSMRSMAAAKCQSQ